VHSIWSVGSVNTPVLYQLESMRRGVLSVLLALPGPFFAAACTTNTALSIMQ